MPGLVDRTGKGLFKRSLKGAERDAECARMRAGGYTLREIAEHVGLQTESAVGKAIARALKDVQAPAVEALRASQQSTLDLLKSQALDILARTHLAHSNGRVVYSGDIGDTGDLVPVLDDGPRLAAIRELRQLLERESKLWG